MVALRSAELLCHLPSQIMQALGKKEFTTPNNSSDLAPCTGSMVTPMNRPIRFCERRGNVRAETCQWFGAEVRPECRAAAGRVRDSS